MVKQLVNQVDVSSKLQAIVQLFERTYLKAVQQSGISIEEGSRLFNQLISLMKQQAKAPYKFSLFHKSLRTPFDYYQFGLDFIRPLIDFKESKVLGTDHIQKMIEQTSRGENVILLANHQTEPDPQILNLLLDPLNASFASQMIFIAGHRVVEDPIAIPMSMGCNLLCIYSKKHMNHPLEDRAKKVSHNQRTMKKMCDLLQEGSKCIYVAPSGGRDRSNKQGIVTPAAFDPDSLEMFWLMAQKSKRPTHFYPLALLTYDMLPPPPQVELELGERREAAYTPVYLAFGPEVDMEHFSEREGLDKKTKRVKRAEYVWSLVCEHYEKLTHLANQYRLKKILPKYTPST